MKKITAVSILCVAALLGASDWHGRADRNWNRSMRLKKKGDLAGAVKYLRVSIKAEIKSRKIRPSFLSRQLREISSIYYSLKEYDKALYHYRLLKKAGRKYSDKDAFADGCIGAGNSSMRLGKFPSAENYFQQARKSLDGTADYGRLSRVYGGLGRLSRERGDWGKALSSYWKALEYVKKTGLSGNVAAIYGELGILYFFKGEYEKALGLFGKALDIDVRGGKKEDISTDYSNMANVYRITGRYGEAINYLEKALEIDRGLSHRRNIAARLHNLGQIYDGIGDTDRAVEFLKESLRINSELQDNVNTAVLHRDLGRVYELSGKFSLALDHYMKAVSLNKKMSADSAVSPRLSDLGHLYSLRGRYLDALDMYSASIENKFLLPGGKDTAEDFSGIGRILLHLGKYRKAVKNFKTAVKIRRRKDEYREICDDYRNIGIALLKLDRADLAGKFFRKSLKILMKKCSGSDFTILDDIKDSFYWIVRSDIMSKKLMKGLVNSERYFPVLMERIFEDSPVKNSGGREILTALKKINGNTAYIVFFGTGTGEPLRLAVHKDNVSGEVLNLGPFIKKMFLLYGKEITEYISMKGIKKLNLVKRVRSTRYVIDFQDIIFYFRGLLSKRYLSAAEMEAVKKISEELNSALLGDVLDSGKPDSIIFRADGVLTLLPFGVLMQKGKYLASMYNISMTVSPLLDDVMSGKDVSSEKVMFLPASGKFPAKSKKDTAGSERFISYFNRRIGQKIMRGESLRDELAFYGEDIKDFSSSANNRGNYYSGGGKVTAVQKGPINEEEIRAMSRRGDFSGYAYIHFGTPFITSGIMPLLSGMIAAPSDKFDGFLNLREISRLKMSVRSILLTSPVIPPERIVAQGGIPLICGAFAAAGSRSILLSLWPVDSAFEGRLMSLLMGKGEKSRKGIFASLADFQKQMGGSNYSSPFEKEAGNEGMQFSSPYYWASYVYYGPVN